MKKLYIFVLLAVLKVAPIFSAAQDIFSDFLIFLSQIGKRPFHRHLINKKSATREEIEEDIQKLVENGYFLLPIRCKDEDEIDNRWPVQSINRKRTIAVIGLYPKMQYWYINPDLSEDNDCPCVMTMPRSRKCVIRLNTHTGLFTTYYDE